MPTCSKVAHEEQGPHGCPSPRKRGACRSHVVPRAAGTIRLSFCSWVHIGLVMVQLPCFSGSWVLQLWNGSIRQGPEFSVLATGWSLVMDEWSFTGYPPEVQMLPHEWGGSGWMWETNMGKLSMWGPALVTCPTREDGILCLWDEVHQVREHNWMHTFKTCSSRL